MQSLIINKHTYIPLQGCVSDVCKLNLIKSQLASIAPFDRWMQPHAEADRGKGLSKSGPVANFLCTPTNPSQPLRSVTSYHARHQGGSMRKPAVVYIATRALLVPLTTRPVRSISLSLIFLASEIDR
jgi:hypothetical protein